MCPKNPPSSDDGGAIVPRSEKQAWRRPGQEPASGLAGAQWRRRARGVFTGIIEAIGRVQQVMARPQGARLTIDLAALAEDLRLGDSICCSGVCLTAVACENTLADFDVSAETLRRSTLGEWRAGTAINLERALRLGDRLGGHLVGGHIDGVGRLVERRREGDGERFTFCLPDGGSVRVVEKGSVAVDGISLTTWDCRGARFSVALVPHSLERTTLAGLRPGARVNLETDPIGRWVQALLGGARG